MEISVTWRGDTVHIVGLGIDPANPRLLTGLEALRLGRDERARRMSAELDRAGIHGAFEGARRFARNPALVSRAHFARHIVSTGLMADVQTVFRYYLAKGKPGYVEHEWASLADAVGWIRAAGGVAVIAHPGRYRLDGGELETLIEEFIALGGRRWRWSQVARSTVKSSASRRLRDAMGCWPRAPPIFMAGRESGRYWRQ